MTGGLEYIKEEPDIKMHATITGNQMTHLSRFDNYPARIFVYSDGSNIATYVELEMLSAFGYVKYYKKIVLFYLAESKCLCVHLPWPEHLRVKASPQASGIIPEAEVSLTFEVGTSVYVRSKGEMIFNLKGMSSEKVVIDISDGFLSI